MAVWLAAGTAPALADLPVANPTTMPFAAGGKIRMKLDKGDIQVVGVAGDRITVSWRSTLPDDERRVTVRVQRSGDREATVFIDGPGNRMRYRIEVPSRSDVVIHMHAGELTAQGIVGSMDVDLMAGEIVLDVLEPERYRTLSASVTAGEIDARPWHVEKSGLWRSLKATSDGDYDLRARLLAGEITLRSGSSPGSERPAR